MRTILNCACIFILALSGSGKAAEQTVLKPLGEWICRASGYYSFNVDLAGHSNPAATPLNASQSQVKISVERETQNDFPLSDNLGAKLRIEIHGSLQVFDTFAGGVAARGELTFIRPLTMSDGWDEKRDALKGLVAMVTSLDDYERLQLAKTGEGWAFSLTKGSITTAKQAKELTIRMGMNFTAGTDIYFLSGECVRN